MKDNRCKAIKIYEHLIKHSDIDLINPTIKPVRLDFEPNYVLQVRNPIITPFTNASFHVVPKKSTSDISVLNQMIDRVLLNKFKNSNANYFYKNLENISFPTLVYEKNETIKLETDKFNLTMCDSMGNHIKRTFDKSTEKNSLEQNIQVHTSTVVKFYPNEEIAQAVINGDLKTGNQDSFLGISNGYSREELSKYDMSFRPTFIEVIKDSLSDYLRL